MSPILAPVRALGLAAALLALALACADDTPGAAADLGPAAAPPPWETGFAREWFYPAHLDKPGNDKRWAHLAAYVGRPAPELRLDQWRGGERSLEELRGRVVLLDFWATWCADCSRAVPAVDALRAALADEPFEVIGVCSPKGAERYDATREQWGIEIPTGVDRDGATERAFGVPRWPYYVLLDADGVIAATGLHPEHLQPAVRHLLARERARGALADG